MKIAVKYLILAFGFLAGFYSLSNNTGTGTGAGITSAGALLAFALLEIQDLKIDNAIEEE